METLEHELILTPDHIPVLSKTNAATFHAKAKERIFENGGAFEYMETIKFFAKLNDVVCGNSSAKIEADKEFVDYLRGEITKHGNGGDKGEVMTKRGVKFTLAEVGTSYDFSMCNDPEFFELEEKSKEATKLLKERKEFLQKLPISGLDITTKDGEGVKIYPPSKSSKSSFKVQLPK